MACLSVSRQHKAIGLPPCGFQKLDSGQRFGSKCLYPLNHSLRPQANVFTYVDFSYIM